MKENIKTVDCNLESHNWQELQNDIGEFTTKTFKNSSARSKALHLSEEAVEAADDPSDITEWADCMILLLDGARQAGFSIDDIYKASIEKMEVNKSRKWSEPDKDGVVRHID